MAVVEYIRNHDHPSIQEIADALGIRQSGAYYHIKRLEADGVVVRVKNRHRSLRLADKEA